jgi:hypothetical protein
MARRCRERYGVSAQRIVILVPPQPPDQKLPFSVERRQYQILLPATKVAVATVEAAVRALPEVRGQASDVALLVMGEPPAAAQVRQLAAEAGLASHVTFLGRVSQAEEWYRYRQSAACIVCLDDELGEREARKAAAAGSVVVELRGDQPLGPAILAALQGQGSSAERWITPSWTDHQSQLLALLQ